MLWVIVLDVVFCAAFLGGCWWLWVIDRRAARARDAVSRLERSCPHACPTATHDLAPHGPHPLGPNHLPPWEGERCAH